MRGHEIQGKLHDVREFLRFVVASGEAVRLAYLHAGLEDGWMEDTQIRRSTHSLRHLCAGPALLRGAIRTELDESRRNWRASGTCCRCNQEVDTLTHCLRRCPDNIPMLEWLASKVGAERIDFEALPPCLRRCGLIPRSLPRWLTKWS